MTSSPRDPIDADVRDAYRNLPDDGVPPELDAQILQQAREAISESSGARWKRWSAPVAIAASLLVVVTVVMDFGAREQAMPTAAQSDQYQADRQRKELVTDLAAKAEERAVQQQHSGELPRTTAPPPPSAEPAAPPPVIVDTHVRSRALNLEGLKEMPPLPDAATAAVPAPSAASAITVEEPARRGRPLMRQREDSEREPVVVTGAMSSPAEQLRNRLVEIYEARESGRLEEAQSLTDDVLAQYPQLNIDLELKAIADERAQESADDSP